MVPGMHRSHCAHISNKVSANIQIYSDLQACNLYLTTLIPSLLNQTSIYMFAFTNLESFFSGLLKQAVSLNSEMTQISRKSTLCKKAAAMFFNLD